LAALEPAGLRGAVNDGRESNVVAQPQVADGLQGVVIDVGGVEGYRSSPWLQYSLRMNRA
jgi:hypothetical protein